MFIDTNVLVYASVPAASDWEKARTALTRHASTGETLCISRQILREYVAVVTRPQIWAQATTSAEAAAAALVIARDF